jgi:fibronectin type 3 domain-containing protein
MKKTYILFGLLFLIATPLKAQAGAGFTKISNVSVLTYADTTCPDLSTCYYQVTALDAQGFESAPAPCSTTVLCQGGNMAVAVMPSSGTHTNTLTWVASTSTAITYNVSRHIGPLAPSNLNAVVN